MSERKKKTETEEFSEDTVKSKKKSTKKEEDTEFTEDSLKKKKSTKKTEDEEFSEDTVKKKKKKPEEEEFSEDTIKKKKSTKSTDEVDEDALKKKKKPPTVPDPKKKDEDIKKKPKKEEPEEEEESDALVAPEPPKSTGLVQLEKDVVNMFEKDWIMSFNYVWDSTPRFVDTVYLSEKSGPEEVKPNEKKAVDEKKTIAPIDPEKAKLNKNTPTMGTIVNTHDAGLEYHVKKQVLKNDKDEKGGDKDLNKKSSASGLDLKRKGKNKVLKKGPCGKKGSWLGFWSQKFLVLRTDKLQWYSNEKAYKGGSKAEGSIFLQNCVVENEEENGNAKLLGKHPHAWSIHGRISYIFECSSKEDKLVWIAAVSDAIKAYFS